MGGVTVIIPIYNEANVLAECIGKCKEKMKGEDLLLRPDTVKIDPDFYDKRANEERMKALRAKFTQNVDLKKVLLATKDAELKHFERGNPLQNDGLLMAVREYILNRFPQIDQKRLRAVGLGSDKPVVPNTTAKGRKENRRVEFVIIDREELLKQ